MNREDAWRERYDEWKTTDPRDNEPEAAEDEYEPPEPEEDYEPWEVECSGAPSAEAEAAGGIVIKVDSGWPEYCSIRFAEKPARKIIEALHAASFHWGGGYGQDREYSRGGET